MSDALKQDVGILGTHMVRANKMLRRVAIKVVGVDAALRRIEERLLKLDKLDAIDAHLSEFTAAVEGARTMKEFFDLSFKEQRRILQLHEARLIHLEGGGEAHDA